MKDKEIEARKKDETNVAAKAEGTREGIYYRPKVDIFETEAELTLIADIPGVEPDELDIDIADDTLTIVGKVKPADEAHNYIMQEYGVGNFFRQFTLSEVIDQEKINANFSNGVLTLKLPKVEKAKPRKITVG
ncbi:MAG: Hsp20/alpha crystallin family protein [Deltaproteobacteria bacterium]|uniref:Hsp20/alpha crystallin family protein n=1 Tax=Candidatus Zymogenus saltonus TaxID=2844893 RepID=A0A9D8PMD7_9DELT|nr:Hsp20/alpha crystallin family protein [Candidatus Zymogenus saltonus]